MHGTWVSSTANKRQCMNAVKSFVVLVSLGMIVLVASLLCRQSLIVLGGI